MDYFILPPGALPQVTVGTATAQRRLDRLERLGRLQKVAHLDADNSSSETATKHMGHLIDGDNETSLPTPSMSTQEGNEEIEGKRGLKRKIGNLLRRKGRDTEGKKKSNPESSDSESRKDGTTIDPQVHSKTVGGRSSRRQNQEKAERAKPRQIVAPWASVATVAGHQGYGACVTGGYFATSPSTLQSSSHSRSPASDDLWTCSGGSRSRATLLQDRFDEQAVVLDGAGTFFDPLVAIQRNQTSTGDEGLPNWESLYSTLVLPNDAVGGAAFLEERKQVKDDSEFQTIDALRVDASAAGGQKAKKKKKKRFEAAFDLKASPAAAAAKDSGASVPVPVGVQATSLIRQLSGPLVIPVKTHQWHPEFDVVRRRH